MTPEDSRDKDACSDLLFEHPLNLKHAPVGLNSNGSESLLFTMSFRFSANKKNQDKLNFILAVTNLSGTFTEQISRLYNGDASLVKSVSVRKINHNTYMRRE